MKKWLLVLCVLCLLPLTVQAEEAICFTEEQTRNMSNFMNMGRYVTVNGELWGRSWNNDVFRATPYTEGGHVKVKDTAVLVQSTVAVYFCADEQNVYCVLEKGWQEKEGIIAISIATGEITRLYEGEASFLQLHSGKLYFTDAEHRLLVMDTTGENASIVMEKEVYYPYFVADALLFYQDQNDGETLHSLNLSTGEDVKLLDPPTYGYMIADSILYYCYLKDENVRLGFLNLATGENTQRDFCCGNSIYVDGEAVHFADDSTVPVGNSFVYQRDIPGYATTQLSYVYSNGEYYIRYGWKNNSYNISRMQLKCCGKNSVEFNLDIQ